MIYEKTAIGVLLRHYWQKISAAAATREICNIDDTARWWFFHFNAPL